jgi:hypothetical protein
MCDLKSILSEYGPMTGKDLIDRSGEDGYDVWKFCYSSKDVITKVAGKRYLRLDPHVEGYARLSPSILREFYGYTAIGLSGQEEEIRKKAESISQSITDISRNKFNLAQEVTAGILMSSEKLRSSESNICFIISGDVVYNMSHMEPRAEPSTGRLVMGSDLDIVVIADRFDKDLFEHLDQAIYREKYFLLNNPSYKEEIDYIIKDMSKVEKQLSFDCFESMVACKILHEGKYLCGSRDIFDTIKQMLKTSGIPDKLLSLEQKAAVDREKAEAKLLESSRPLSRKEFIQLFYTTDEKEEFY